MTREEFLKPEIREGFQVSEKRKHLWWLELKMVEKFQQICEKHNLTYFAVGGTLLGAVRHKGFIPWDDDIDLGMMRGDYEKFLKVAPKELGDKYFLQIPDSDPGYHAGIAKIRMNGTTCMMYNLWEHGVPFHQGVFIDIIPLDAVPDNPVIRKIHQYFVVKCNDIARGSMYNLKLDSIRNKRTLKRYRVYTTLIKPIRFTHGRDSLAQLFSKSQTREIGQVGNHYKVYPKFFWDRRCYKETEDAAFEHLTIKIPKGYREILTKLYGDWEVPAQQNNNHGTLFFDPNKSYTEYQDKYDTYVGHFDL